MKCVECGSKSLVWDYKSGFIVCSSCGIVNDRIVTGDLPRDRENGVPTTKFRKSAYHKWIRQKEQSYMEFKRVSRKRGIGSKELIVDSSTFEEYVSGKRKPVKLLLTEGSLRARRLLTENGEIRFIVENIIRKHPTLNSRTERAKVALALIMLYMRESKSLDSKVVKEISEKTGASCSHIRRLHSLLEKTFKHSVPTCSVGETAHPQLRTF